MLLSGDRARGWLAQQADTVDSLYTTIGGDYTGEDGKTFEILNVNDRAILADAVTCIQDLRKRLSEAEEKLANKTA
ncbi:hypothetical protein [Pantoea dispersa]|uniref:hypothetical protein n=1 Tax=Pantoea dispersa TaxID=59814 RepID=UPI0028582D52|nr:hypothetical protein [Pantoea dispersa]MDR6297777.1 hypothetical protein [Pantoea dispersa]